MKQGKSVGFDSCEQHSKLAQIWSKCLIFQPVWSWNLMDDLKNDRTTLLYYIKLCASFQIHWWIQSEVTVRKRSIQVKIGEFLSCVTLKFDGWTWKTIGHLFYAISSFVHHFIAVSELKLGLQSKTLNWNQNGWFFVRCDVEIWRMTLKNNRHLFYATSSFVHRFVAIDLFKLELQSGNIKFGSKSTIFYPVRPWNSIDNLEKL